MEQRHSKSVGAPPPIIDIVFDEPEHTPPSKQTKGKSAERPIVVDEHTTPPSKQTKGTSDERPMAVDEDYEGEGEGEGDLMDTDNYEPRDVLSISGKNDEYTV